MWNNSKSPIRYMWEKVSHCHIIEVEPCTGVIGSLPVGGCGLPRAGCGGTPYKTLDTCGQIQPWPGRKSSPPLVSTSMSSSSPEPNEVKGFELNLTGGVPGSISQDLECEIKDSPCPVVLHIEASFKVPWELGSW